MTTTNQDIPTDGDDEYYAGNTAVITDTVTKDDGSAKDLSGADVAFALSEYAGAPALISKDSDGSDVTITDASGGKVEVTINPSDTADLGSPDGFDYHYQIEARDSSDQEAHVTTGTWTIVSSSTTLP